MDSDHSMSHWNTRPVVQVRNYQGILSKMVRGVLECCVHSTLSKQDHHHDSFVKINGA
jgi:hypothetical protein